MANMPNVAHQMIEEVEEAEELGVSARDEEEKIP